MGWSGGNAFLYSGGVMTDLNTLIDPASGWVLEEARDINEPGQIVGWGMHNGQPRAYLLTKLEPNKPPLAQSIAVKTVSPLAPGEKAKPRRIRPNPAHPCPFFIPEPPF